MEVAVGGGVLHIGNALEELKRIPDSSVDCVITSPPYYMLRQYGKSGETECVWGGDPECEHEWEEANVANNRKELDPQYKNLGSFCLRCGAWKGELGHEPDPDLFVSHLADVFDEVYRVLKPTGNLFLNIGDTYAGGGGTTGGYALSWERESGGSSESGYRPCHRGTQRIVGSKKWIKRKQLLLIPYRLAIELQMRGWIIRDVIVWAKSVSVLGKSGEIVEQFGNGLPESTKDRLTKSYEVIIHAVKSERYYFSKPRAWANPEGTAEKLRVASEDRECAQLFQYDGGKERSEPRLMKVIGGGKSKFLETDMDRNNCGSLAGKVIRNLQRGKEYALVRKAIENVNEYLKQKLKESGYSVRKIAEMTGLKEDIIAHYFRTDDKGACLPSKEAWEKMKPLLGLGEYEDYIREEYKSVIPEMDGTSYGRNVVQANTEPFPGAHFAVMPSKLVRFLMRMGCPEKVCSGCGKPYEKVGGEALKPSCDCGAPPASGVVLDPFMGAGTVAYVAEELGRKWIGVEIKPEYAELIRKRVRNVQRALF